jgi:hypothetical protein
MPCCVEGEIALGFEKKPFCVGLEARPFVFHFVFDALVEPNGVLGIPAEGELLGLPNTGGEELVEAVDAPENMLLEGAPKGFDCLKLEDGAEALFVFD